MCNSWISNTKTNFQRLPDIVYSTGSGKTSLLDVISCRTKGTVSGKVYYNNIECTKDVFQQYGTYVMQADRLLPSLTVRETLRYSALLRLPGNTSSFDIEQKVFILFCTFVSIDHTRLWFVHVYLMSPIDLSMS